MTELMRTLINEYIADPNCRPREWVAGEVKTNYEVDFFVNNQEVKDAWNKEQQSRAESAAERAFNKSHPELNP